jgi:hypothetical protein
MNTRETNEIREPKLGNGEEVFRELTASELEDVTGAGFSIGKALSGVISAPFKAVAAVA